MRKAPDDSLERRLARLKSSANPASEDSLELRLVRLKYKAGPELQDILERRLERLKSRVRSAPEDSLERCRARHETNERLAPKDSLELRLARLKNNTRSALHVSGPSISLKARLRLLSTTTTPAQREVSGSMVYPSYHTLYKLRSDLPRLHKLCTNGVATITFLRRIQRRLTALLTDILYHHLKPASQKINLFENHLLTECSVCQVAQVTKDTHYILSTCCNMTGEKNPYSQLESLLTEHHDALCSTLLFEYDKIYWPYSEAGALAAQLALLTSPMSLDDAILCNHEFTKKRETLLAHCLQVTDLLHRIPSKHPLQEPVQLLQKTLLDLHDRCYRIQTAWQRQHAINWLKQKLPVIREVHLEIENEAKKHDELQALLSEDTLAERQKNLLAPTPLRFCRH